jgi:uncharacterized protein
VSLFLAVFLLLYGLIHFYAFLKIRSAVALGPLWSACLTIFMVIMIVAPLLVRVAEKGGYESIPRYMAHVGYTWMGLLFLFVTFSLCIDLCRLVLYVGGLLLRRDFAVFIHAYRYFFCAALVYTLVAGAYGYVDALRIRTERVMVLTEKVPLEAGVLRIVQISDVHLGFIVGEERLERIVAAVRQAAPDMIVSTGDLVDGQIELLNGAVPILKSLSPRYGKFAVTGNHEYYAGIGAALAFAEKTGFRMLRGEAATVDGLINIAGVDDIAGKPYGYYVDVHERELLAGCPQGLFTLLLKHRPVVDPAAVGFFDLQLSGHVHKGQIFPFRLFTRILFRYVYGLFTLGGNSRLYVNRGTGTWGPPIRFLAPPEVTVIELAHP